MNKCFLFFNSQKQTNSGDNEENTPSEIVIEQPRNEENTPPEIIIEQPRNVHGPRSGYHMYRRFWNSRARL